MANATVFKLVSFSRLHYRSFTSTVGSSIHQYKSTVHPGYQGEKRTTLVTGTDTRSIYSSRVSGVLVSSQLTLPQAHAPPRARTPKTLPNTQTMSDVDKLAIAGWAGGISHPRARACKCLVKQAQKSGTRIEVRDIFEREWLR